MQERVRICDIAEELGLSTATVSNVIHGKTNKVSDETVRRVTALLEERQYIPSMAGILLARNSSGIIGVFVNDHPKYAGHTLRDGFIASALDALSTEIERGGQFMLVKKARCAGDVVRFASMWNMDGLVMTGFCEQDYTDLRRHIRIPIVVYDGLCRDPERLVNLSIDNYDGGYQMGRRALGSGRADERRVCGDLPGRAHGKAADAADFVCLRAGRAVQGAQYDPRRRHSPQRRADGVRYGHRSCRNVGLRCSGGASDGLRVCAAGAVCVLCAVTGGMPPLRHLSGRLPQEKVDAPTVRACGLSKKAEKARLALLRQPGWSFTGEMLVPDLTS